MNKSDRIEHLLIDLETAQDAIIHFKEELTDTQLSKKDYSIITEELQFWIDTFNICNYELGLI